MSDIIIAALPAKNDPVNLVSSEQVAHMTMIIMNELRFGEYDWVVKCISDTISLIELGSVSLPITKRTTLGEDAADVVMLDAGPFVWLRDSLIANPQINEAMSRVYQYPNWTPHVTLGYPENPASGTLNQTEIVFDRIALWTGDYAGAEFSLKREWSRVFTPLKGVNDGD
jgi:hypothetical protein